jgi:tetratricopeptide (TPR) repeat protein
MQLGRGIAVFLALCFFSIAQAEESESARAHYHLGTKAFELGLFDEAIREYTAAFEIKDDPALLFDIAQAHRLAGRPVEAIRFFRAYLIKSPNAKNRALVESRIAQLSPSAEARPVPSPVVTSPPEPAQAPASNPPALQDRNGRRLWISGLVVATAGLGTLGAGLACGLLAQDAANRLTEAARAGAPFDPALERAGLENQMLAGVFLGVGAASVVTGTVLTVIGFRRARRSAPVTVAPVVNAGAAGLTARVSF